jgi:hypothetical protein
MMRIFVLLCVFVSVLPLRATAQRALTAVTIVSPGGRGLESVSGVSEAPEGAGPLPQGAGSPGPLPAGKSLDVFGKPVSEGNGKASPPDSTAPHNEVRRAGTCDLDGASWHGSGARCGVVAWRERR